MLTFEVRDRDTLVPGKTACIGTVRVDARKIVDRYCTEERIEFPIVNDVFSAVRDGIICWGDDDEEDDGEKVGSEKVAEKGKDGDENDTNESSLPDTPKLALRFRRATSDDVQFMENLQAGDLDGIAQDNYGVSSSSNSPTTKQEDGSTGKKNKNQPNKRRSSSVLMTEDDGLVQVGEVFDRVKFALNSSQGRGHQLKLRVKPGPDPARPEKTRFLSEEELIAAAYSPSKSWVEAGSGCHGKVYVEVLHCDDLPNCDVGGGGVGNKTQVFVSIVLEDTVVQTDTIQNCLSPLWMPWTRRAFACNRMHPLSSMYVGVFHYDNVNPLGHRGIGRVAINLQQLRPNHVYLLKYNLYNSPVYSNRTPTGAIAIRLRIDPVGSEKALLLESIKPIPEIQINVKRKKSMAVVKYTCYGQHVEDRFDINLLKSQANEMLDLVQGSTYAVGNAFKSLAFWKGQVRIGKVKFPLYSMMAFIGGSYVVERPYLLPSLFFWFIALAMLASYGHRYHHPSPWHRCLNVADFFYILAKGGSMPTPTRIKAGEGAKEAAGLQAAWEGRIELAAVAANKKTEMQRRVSEVEDVADDKKNGPKVPQIDPMTMLIPVQQKLQEVIFFPRLIKSVVTLGSSTLAFAITVGSLGAAILLSALPTTWIMQWICRIAVQVGLGPHMKLVDIIFNSHVVYEDEGDRLKHKQNMIENLTMTFKAKNKAARIKAEDTLKRYMPCERFGWAILSSKYHRGTLTFRCQNPRPCQSRLHPSPQRAGMIAWLFRDSTYTAQ